MNRSTARGLGLALAVAGAAALAQSPAAAQSPAVARYEAAAAEHAAGNLTGAIELYQQALLANPAYLEPRAGLAGAFFELGEYAEALVHIRRARELSDDLELASDEGRIRTGLGDYGGARRLFEQVLAELPNSTAARLGLAEVDLAEGRLGQATDRFMRALALAPRNARALRSLVLVHQARGELAEAELFLQRALRFHSSDAEVHLLAGRTRLAFGAAAGAEQAIRHLETALELRGGGFPEARISLAEAYLLAGRPAAAAESLSPRAAATVGDHMLHYLRGLALQRQGRTEEAIASFAHALTLAPGEEVVRLALEGLVIEHAASDHSQRAELSRHRLREGAELEERNFLGLARVAYRRARLLDPRSRDAGFALASVSKLRGFPLDYLNRLRVLAVDHSDAEISDEIELFAARDEESLAARWSVDQFATDSARIGTCVAVFFEPPPQWLHLDAGTPISQLLISELQSVAGVRVPDLTTAGEDPPTAAACSAPTARPYLPAVEARFDLAFDRARRAGSAYFVHLRFLEDERSFVAQANVHLSATGAGLMSLRAFRTGNNRVRDAIVQIAEEVRAALPWQFRLLDRRFGSGLIDGGRAHGLEVDQRLLVVRRDAVGRERDAIALSVAEEDVLGTFVVTEVDEKVAAGELERQRFFDFVNVGDLVIHPPPERPPEPMEADAPPPGFLQRILDGLLRIRGR